MQLDFVVLNLHVDRNGSNAYELAAAKSIFSVVDGLDTKVQAGDSALSLRLRRASNWNEAVEIVREQFVPREAYFHYDGEPVLFLLLDGRARRQQAAVEFRRRDSPRASCASPPACGCTRPRKSAAIRSDCFTAGACSRRWSSPRRPTGSASGPRPTGTAAPARANLRILSSRPATTTATCATPIARAIRIAGSIASDGGTYRRMLSFALSVEEPPDMVIISTFNEYHENTHIESSRDHGSLYVD